MIILDKDDEYVKCSCGQQFIVSPQDVTGPIIVKNCFYRSYVCPNCGNLIMTINALEDGSEIIEIEKEKEDEKDNNE